MTEFFSNIKDILKGAEFASVNPVFAKIIADGDNIVGKKYAGKVEFGNFFKKGAKLFLTINVKSSPLVQELSFFKPNIIRKIRENYGIELSEIIIKVAQQNYRTQGQFKPEVVQETYDIRPSDEDLEQISLSPESIEDIKKSVQNQPTLSDEQKNRMLNIIIKDLKTQEWMKQKGFPVCKKCGRVLTQKTFGEEDLCQFCKNTEN